MQPHLLQMIAIISGPKFVAYVAVEKVGAMIHCTSCGLTCSEASVFHHVQSDVLQ